MKQRLPHIFETKLQQKCHEAKLDAIRRRKTQRDVGESLRKHSSKKGIAFTFEEKEIAMENLQLVKRLTEVRYKPAEITKFWSKSSKQQSHPGRTNPPKPTQNILKERERIAQNERLGRSIDTMARRGRGKQW